MPGRESRCCVSKDASRALCSAAASSAADVELLVIAVFLIVHRWRRWLLRTKVGAVVVVHRFCLGGAWRRS
jgi:hypothetical protein